MNSLRFLSLGVSQFDLGRIGLGSHPDGDGGTLVDNTRGSPLDTQVYPKTEGLTGSLGQSPTTGRGSLSTLLPSSLLPVVSHWVPSPPELGSGETEVSGRMEENSENGRVTLCHWSFLVLTQEVKK